MSHRTAKPSHYDKQAATYDAFNEENSKALNRLLELILRRHKAKTVLDLACGTGSQLLWLTRRGFSVVGCDINAVMLGIARRKARTARVGARILRGDMRTVLVGRFDAAITISSAVGHLTRADFEKAMRNIHRNLNPGGLYIFDIFNLNRVLHRDNIKLLTIDWLKEQGKSRIRDIQYSTVDEDGVLTSHTTSYRQNGSGKPRVGKYSETLQLYTAGQLADMLRRNGFRVLRQCGTDGARFSDRKTGRILTIAKRRSQEPRNRAGLRASSIQPTASSFQRPASKLRA